MAILPKNNGFADGAGAENGAHAPFRLMQEIIARSGSGIWHEAKLEWALSHVYFSPTDEPGVCLCGHAPIREHCVITNRLNGNVAVVGNCCVKRFIGLPSGSIFAGLRRIARNPESALSPAAAEYAHRAGLLDRWEYEFCLNSHDKPAHRLSPRQLAKRVEINAKVLRLASRQGAKGAGHAQAE